MDALHWRKPMQPEQVFPDPATLHSREEALRQLDGRRLESWQIVSLKKAYKQEIDALSKDWAVPDLRWLVTLTKFRLEGSKNGHDRTEHGSSVRKAALSLLARFITREDPIVLKAFEDACLDTEDRFWETDGAGRQHGAAADVAEYATVIASRGLIPHLVHKRLMRFADRPPEDIGRDIQLLKRFGYAAGLGLLEEIAKSHPSTEICRLAVQAITSIKTNQTMREFRDRCEELQTA